MPTGTTVTIGGLAMPMNLYNFWPVRLCMRFDAYCTLTLQKRGWALPGLPDPWLGKPIVLAVNGTIYFQGNVSDADPTYADIGWITTYQCLDLKRRCDLVPMTDSNTLTDTAAFNLTPEDPLALASRQGRNIGQILTSVLTMQDNANALDARGWARTQA